MNTATRYSVAVLLVAAVLLVGLSLPHAASAEAPLLQFLPAIVGAAWLGGAGPGLVATALATLAATVFFIPPTPSLGIASHADLVATAFFVATGLAICWFTHRLRTAEQRAIAAAAHGHARAQQLQTVLDTAADAIIVIDAAGHVESFNRGAERLFGYAASEIVGRNVSVLMPSPDREQHDDYLARYLATGTAHVIGRGREVQGRHRDGQLLPLQLSVGEMTIAGGRKFTGLLHDLRARNEQREQRRSSDARWQSVIESAVDAIVVIDASGLIEAFNPSAERLFGYLEAEVVGSNVSMLMPSPYREEHDRYLARYLQTGVKKIIGLGREVQGLRRDGTTFPLHLSVGEMNVDGVRRFTGILHDLSARTAMERQLREQMALARLGEMAAVVAHEVKNPLTGIRGAIEIIGGRLPHDSTDRRIVGEIVSRIDALNALMKDLLLFAGPPKPQPQWIDLGTLVATTAELLRADPHARDVAVHTEGEAPPTLADASLLQIVFHNLLVNSAQAMDGRGTVRVALSGGDGHAQVAFTDDGPGIPADVAARIFTPFFTTKARGSGLGLATCRRLVEAHGGTIDLATPSSGGTTVVIVLPRTPPPAAATADPVS